MSSSNQSMYYTQPTKPQTNISKEVDCLIDQHIYVYNFYKVKEFFYKEEIITSFYTLLSHHAYKLY